MKLYRFLPVFVASLHLSVAMAAENQRPPEHFCPINMAVMTDPVVAADGHTYEKDAIMQWFRNHNTSPMTNLPIENKLFPNVALRTTIANWTPEMQGRPSAFNGRPAQEIAQRVREEFARNAHLLEPAHTARGKHIVAFLGNTGCGKSTLVNLLTNQPLDISPVGQYVLRPPVAPTAMPIGEGADSQTRYPKSIDVGDDVRSLRFFDLPGFCDTDGSERNLVNSAFIRQILLDAASVRLVIVAGQDQFTADRGASAFQMIEAFKRLFVVEGPNPITQSILVLTKFNGPQAANTFDFLKSATKTDNPAKQDFPLQIDAWNNAGRIFRVFSADPDAPVKHERNVALRDQMLPVLQAVVPVHMRGINISALYPPETSSDLQRMFVSMIEETFAHKLQEPVTTISEYDRAIRMYTTDFWTLFKEELQRNPDINLLRTFASTPYERAYTSVSSDKDAQRQAHITRLNQAKTARIEHIKQQTKDRTQQAIQAVPQPDSDAFIPFNFGQHPAFYDQVCGVETIRRITEDLAEQEVVRHHHVHLIAQHSHEQMTKWFERFSGVAALTKRLEEEVRSRDRQNSDLKRQLESSMAGLTRRLGVVEEFTRIPDIARGYESIYRKFLQGRFEYRPEENSDVGKIELPIAALSNPLDGVFDLSRCGDVGQEVYIATGYRKRKIPGNKNKLEIWITPRFLVEKNLDKDAMHLRDRMQEWRAPFGIFFTWGNWDDLTSYDYLTSDIATPPQNLYVKAVLASRARGTETLSDPLMLAWRLGGTSLSHHTKNFMCIFS